MPRHASDATTPYMVPAYYLTADTRDYPLVLLIDHGQPWARGPFPVACGVRQAHGVRMGQPEALCNECGGWGADIDVESGDGPADPYHLSCIVGGDHYGLIPTCYVDLLDDDTAASR